VEDLYECEMKVSLRLTRPGQNTMISAIWLLATVRFLFLPRASWQ
jgi:hypothetical protein